MSHRERKKVDPYVSDSLCMHSVLYSAVLVFSLGGTYICFFESLYVLVFVLVFVTTLSSCSTFVIGAISYSNTLAVVSSSKGTLLETFRRIQD